MLRVVGKWAGWIFLLLLVVIWLTTVTTGNSFAATAGTLVGDAVNAFVIFVKALASHLHHTS